MTIFNTTRGPFSIQCLSCSNGDGNVSGGEGVENDEAASRVDWGGWHAKRVGGYSLVFNKISSKYLTLLTALCSYVFSNICIMMHNCNMCAYVLSLQCTAI